MARPPEDLLERFWNKVDVAKSGCWNWLGAKYQTGYGYIYTRPKIQEYAHRLSYCIHNRKEPKYNVLHRCSNPRCVNPSHLYDGTQGENNRDTYNWRHVRRCRFYSGEIALIKKLSYYRISQYFIASMFKAGQSEISRIISNERYYLSKDGKRVIDCGYSLHCQ